MNELHETSGPKIRGRVLIKDCDTQEVLVEKDNAINFEAMALAIALSLADRPDGPVMSIAFGNGASSVSATGVITYLAPNVTGLTASTLYNQTYSKFINDATALDTDPADNFISVNHTNNTTFADLVVTCLLDYNEPAGQAAFDNAVQTNGTFIFDELGLSSFNPSTSQGQLLTHVVFHPVQKALDRRIQVQYFLRIAMA